MNIIIRCFNEDSLNRYQESFFFQISNNKSKLLLKYNRKRLLFVFQEEILEIQDRFFHNIIFTKNEN